MSAINIHAKVRSGLPVEAPSVSPVANFPITKAQRAAEEQQRLLAFRATLPRQLVALVVHGQSNGWLVTPSQRRLVLTLHTAVASVYAAHAQSTNGASTPFAPPEVIQASAEEWSSDACQALLATHIVVLTVHLGDRQAAERTRSLLPKSLLSADQLHFESSNGSGSSDATAAAKNDAFRVVLIGGSVSYVLRVNDVRPALARPRDLRNGIDAKCNAAALRCATEDALCVVAVVAAQETTADFQVTAVAAGDVDAAALDLAPDAAVDRLRLLIEQSAAVALSRPAPAR